MKNRITLTRDAQVGIYNTEYTARIYPDKIILHAPYIKWAGNSGMLEHRKTAIRDQEIVDQVRVDIADDAEDSAWSRIGHAAQDEYLDQEMLR